MQSTSPGVRRSRRGAAILAGAAAACLLTAADPAATFPGCAPPSGGGDWTSYSHDHANSRHQPEETELGPELARALAPAFTVDLVALGATGGVDNTPAIADGCLFVATNAGSLMALNADTGALVWAQTVRAGMRGSPTVADGLVIVNVNETDRPYTAAFDQATGDPVWETVIDEQPGSGTESAPVVFDGMVFAGVSGFLAESGTTFYGTQQSRLLFRGAWAILDQRTGAILAKDYVIPDEDFAAGFTGGGVWSTPAVDVEQGYAYVGAGNPFSATEHENTNSVLKIDVDPSRPTFGHIVANYHGDNDQYVDAVNHKPTCEAYVDVFTCENFDLDFGASPQLFHDSDGRPLLGNLQKSGNYHAIDPETMTEVWKTRVGGLLIVFVGNMGTATFDGNSIIVGGSGPSAEWSLDPADGSPHWVAPVSDPRHIQPTSSAAGVAYSIDSQGVLNIWDAETGEILQARPMSQDTGSTGTTSGPGVAIARHTVYAATGEFVVAYRPDLDAAPGASLPPVSRRVPSA